MAENEDNTVSNDPEAAPETQPEVADVAPEPEPPPAPGIPKEDYVSVRGRSGVKRMRRSEYNKMKEAEGG